MARMSSRQAVFFCLLILLQEFGPAHFARIPDIKYTNDFIVDDYEDPSDYEDEETDGPEDNTQDDISTSLAPLPIETQTSSRRGWITVAIKVVKIGTKVSVAATSLAGLTNAIFRAIAGCCTDFPDACKYRDEFLAKKVKVEEKSKEADNLQLQARNLQVWVEENIAKYKTVYRELTKISNEQDIYLETLSPEIQTTLNNEEKKIMDAIKKKNNTKDEVDFLQVSSMYESAIDSAMNIGFPLMGLMISGGMEIYNAVKKRKALTKTSQLERKNGIRLKVPKNANINQQKAIKLGKASLVEGFKTHASNLKKRLNTKFSKAVKIVKGIGKAFGIALGLFGSGLAVYQIIQSVKACQDRRNNARDARNEVVKALATFDEAIANITASKNKMNEAFGSVRKELVAGNLMTLLEKTKQMVENANPNADMVGVANGLQSYMDGIKTDVSPKQTYAHQENLIKNLFKIPFTVRCYTTKVKMLKYVLNGCRNGETTYDKLYTSAQKLFGSDPSNPDDPRRCERKIGDAYVTKSSLKTELEKVMAKEEKNKMCELNDPAKKQISCRYKNDGYTPPQIAGKMKLSEVAVNFLIADCPKPELTPMQKNMVCNMRNIGMKDQAIVTIIPGVDLDQLKAVKC